MIVRRLAVIAFSSAIGLGIALHELPKQTAGAMTATVALPAAH